MGKARLLYELSFFMVLVFVLVNKFSENEMVIKGCFYALAASIVYQLLYILILHRRNMLSMGRTIAIGGVFFSIDLIVIIAVFAVTVLLREHANVGAIFSSLQLCNFYDLPEFIDLPAGNLLVLAA